MNLFPNIGEGVSVAAQAQPVDSEPVSKACPVCDGRGFYGIPGKRCEFCVMNELGNRYRELNRQPPSVSTAQPVDSANNLIREFIELCATGDVDEDTEVFGWGDLVKRAKAYLAQEACMSRAWRKHPTEQFIEWYVDDTGAILAEVSCSEGVAPYYINVYGTEGKVKYVGLEFAKKAAELVVPPELPDYIE